ncbi:MAG TPA: thiamine phosphate synthase [Candidatus Sphingobacterium stercoripullorum]|uniref:Thiamine phosphate synthase n=1 Tax=Candidatus Sphingobacterium stercoripullorum TaxID=2838759 RepID=A0A9D2B041_9SPHI|nr:thiamine phosphate synthase [Candidatus Sphingobacterium stercoripullorum]HLR49195.1 thiamine phosphate synthase [Candidatus Sphingobacterium stercoripullorum]
MIIGISSEVEVSNEHTTIHQLLGGGMDLFHIRKYQYSDEMIKAYVGRIDPSFRDRLVLHSHLHLAGNLQIKRIHCNEKNRVLGWPFLRGDFILSTSVHSIADFNRLSEEWTYAFLSPMFPSISKKGYGVKQTVCSKLKERVNFKTKLIGLGGIDSENYKGLRELGADGAALLGSLWHSTQPLKTLRKCKEIDRLF